METDITHEAFVKMLAENLGLTYEFLITNPTFAVKTNGRGRKFVRIIEYQGINFKGKNVLYIGCAYGGMSIEPAKKGAKAIGIDIKDHLLNYAKANAANEAEVEFKKCDASSIEFKKFISQSWADIIIINDVLEHIYDTVGLMENIFYAASSGCLLYYVVPNGRSVRFVKSEDHKKFFALSIIAPDCRHYFLTGRNRIFYRRWTYFDSLFDYFGFAPFKDLTKFKAPMN